MAVVKLELLDDWSGQVTKDGWELTRTANVSGLTGTITARLFTAYETAGLPQVWSSHPDKATLFVRRVSPEAITGDQVKFRIYYSEKGDVSGAAPDNRDSASIEIGGSVSEVETNKDIDGTAFSVAYTYPADYKENPEFRGQTFTTGGTVTKPVPNKSIIYTNVTRYNPDAVIEEFLGTVNSGSWSLAYGALARTWMWTTMKARTTDRGDTWSLTYVCDYRADTWDKTVAYHDPHTGEPPADLVQDTGIVTYVVHETKNFNALYL